jgi:hypothetical protein
MANQLREIMQTYSLSVEQVAELLNLSEDTIKAYLKPVTSNSHRVMPESRLDHLRLILLLQSQKKP